MASRARLLLRGPGRRLYSDGTEEVIIRERIQRWLIPSLSQWLWLAIFCVLLAQPWRTMLVASDGDSFLHWRSGEWMLQHHAIIRQDMFSHTQSGKPFIAIEWLAQVVLAWGAGRWGLYGMALVAATVIATTFALLHRQLVRDGSDAVTATVVALLAAWAARLHWLARPHVFSFLMVLLWHDAVRRHERDGRAGRLMVVVGGLMLVWVNLHGAFLAGFMVLGAYWLGAVMERDRRKAWTLAKAAAVCGAVSLINPNGWKLHWHTLRFLQAHELLDWVAEFRSPNLHSGELRGFVVWLALMLVVLAVLRPKLPAGEALVVLSWFGFALQMARNIPLLAILSAPILAPAISSWLRQRWPQLAREHPPGAACLVPVLALVVAVLLPRPIELPAVNWPIKAVKYVRQHPEQVTGNLFNEYVWGGYLVRELPEHKVFVDGRGDFYGGALIREFDATSRLATNWTAALDKYHVQWTLLPTPHRLNAALASAPGWQRVYTDETAVVCCRIP